MTCHEGSQMMIAGLDAALYAGFLGVELDVDMSGDGLVTPLRACGPAGGSLAKGMKKISYRGYRFPPEIIQQAIWLYLPPT